MVEYIRLFALIHSPSLVLGEEVDLDRETERGHFFLCHDDVQGGVDVRIRSQVELDVQPVQLDVRRHPVLKLSVRQGTEIPVYQRDFPAYVRDHLLAACLHRVQVHEYTFVGPAASAFLHSAPVFERRADKGVWRNHCDSVVPVADLDCVKGYLLDSSVCTAVRHLDPVSQPDHVVLRQLHSGYESQYAVLEYQHEHGR